MKGIPYYVEHDITQPYQGAPMAERVPFGVNIVWYPHPDITIYELALLMRPASGIDRLRPAQFEQLPLTARRHFQIIYNPSDEQSAAWVERWGWKGDAPAGDSDEIVRLRKLADHLFEFHHCNCDDPERTD